MWYCVWILGVLFACALTMISLLWLERREMAEQGASQKK